MSLPQSLLAYEVELDTLDRAASEPKGIRVRHPTHESAYHFRYRLYHAKKLQRAKNREIYEKGDPLYGATSFDNLVVRIRPDLDENEVPTGVYWVYITKNTLNPGRIESLGDDDDLILQPRQPMPQLTYDKEATVVETIKRRV